MVKKLFAVISLVIGIVAGNHAAALSMGPQEFKAARLLTCVLAQESLGLLAGDEYGARTHDVLDGFEPGERDNIYAKAIGYYDGLMFEIPADDADQVNSRLQAFISSDACLSGGNWAPVSL